MQVIIQYLLPHKLLSKIAMFFSNCKIIWIKNLLIKFFINRYSVDMHEAIQSNPFVYTTYNDFFTRLLKPECRPINQQSKSIISPTDGQISQIGIIHKYQIMQAKNYHYDLNSLLGYQNNLIHLFIDGVFATIYLAPQDYHRVHMPFTGNLKKMLYIPGKLFSVNSKVINNIHNVFTRNERVICIFKIKYGFMAVILIGAMIVGSIETTWKGIITPPHLNSLHLWEYQKNNIQIKKGDELGKFKLGSTVMLLFPKQLVKWENELITNTTVRMGQKIGILF